MRQLDNPTPNVRVLQLSLRQGVRVSSSAVWRGDTGRWLVMLGQEEFWFSEKTRTAEYIGGVSLTPPDTPTVVPTRTVPTPSAPAPLTPTATPTPTGMTGDEAAAALAKYVMGCADGLYDPTDRRSVAEKLSSWAIHPQAYNNARGAWAVNGPGFQPVGDGFRWTWAKWTVDDSGTVQPFDSAAEQLLEYFLDRGDGC